MSTPAKWVAPSERLPEPWKRGKTISDVVAILLCHEEIVIGFYSTTSGWYSGGNSIHRDDVTGWYPVPLPADERARRGGK